MNRRDCFALPLILAGCGGSDMEYEIQPSPVRNNYLTHSPVPGYSEGLWTPGISFNGGTTGLTYSKQNGGYVKIGKFVFARFVINLSAKGSSTGRVLVTGLPYAPIRDAPWPHSYFGELMSWTTVNVAAIRVLCFPAGINDTDFELYDITAAVTNVGSTQWDDTDFNNTTAIAGSVSYFIVNA